MKKYNTPKPASIEEISAWESSFGVSMPEDLKALLLSSNGPVLYSEETDKELQFLSTHQAIEYYDEYQFSNSCKNAIPVSMDGCGNFVVYKINQSNIENTYAMSSSNLGWEDAVFLNSNISKVISMVQRVEDVLNS